MTLKKLEGKMVRLSTEKPPNLNPIQYGGARQIRIHQGKHLASISKRGNRTHTIASPDLVKIKHEQDRMQMIINKSLKA